MLLQYFKPGVLRNPTFPSSLTRNTTQYSPIMKRVLFSKGLCRRRNHSHSRIFQSNLSFQFLVLPAFLDSGLSKQNGHKWDSQVPCKVPSLPNPTTHQERLTTPLGSTYLTLFKHWCGFFYVPHEQISESAVRWDLRFSVLIREDQKV